MSSKKPSHFCNFCGNRVNAVETRILGKKYVKLPWYWCNICLKQLEPEQVHIASELLFKYGGDLVQTSIIGKEIAGFGTLQ